MDDVDDTMRVETRKYLAMLYANASQEFLTSAKSDLAAGRYLTILASQRRFLEYSRRAAWLSYFATEEEVVYAHNNPDSRIPKPFPELQDIDVLMRKFVGLDGTSGLGSAVNEEGTTFMQLLHQFTHGGTRAVLTQNTGFKVEGLRTLIEQNERDLTSITCYVLACWLDWSRDVFRGRLSTVQREAEHKQLLSDLYKAFNDRFPDLSSFGA
jgi:hypothetical protein